VTGEEKKKREREKRGYIVATFYVQEWVGYIFVVIDAISFFFW